MYIEKYINDFNDDMYKYYLSDLQKLKQLADAYASQYNNPTYDCTIAFKESLDHYICREFSKNPNIINTTEFKNYLQYINYIFAKRVGNNNSQLEYNTNVVLQNNELKNTILSFYDQDTRKKIEIIIDKNSLAMDEIINKLDNNLSLNQNEADIFSDYLYTRRNLEDRNYIKFIDYILNNKDNLKTSPQIIAAYIAYLPKIYGNGCEYSRAILSNGIAKSNDINTILPNEIDMYRGQKKLRNYGFYSHGDQYISMGWDLLKNLNLYGNKSLDISRTMAGNGKYDTLEEKEEAKEYNDLYWISMTTFHEMTHQLQNNSMKSREFNSSGLAQLIKITKRNDTDNTLNHDSIESEIEADEVAWDKMYSFINKYKLNSKNPIVDKKDVKEQLHKCIQNKESVFARRAIQTKFNSNERFFAADIKEIKYNIDTNEDYKSYFKKIIEYYPMMSKIFDESGNVKTTIMFDNNLTSKNNTGNDENIMSCELSGYILNEEYSVLKSHLINDTLSKNQITNLMMNIYNTYHLEKKFINSLSKLDFSQLKETKINFNYNNQETLQKKYLEKFKNVASLVYKERELVTIINKKYPEYKIEEFSNPKYAYWNYQDMFNHLFKAFNGNVEYDMISDILTKYESSGDPILSGLANETKKNIGFTNDNTLTGKKR